MLKINHTIALDLHFMFTSHVFTEYLCSEIISPFICAVFCWRCTLGCRTLALFPLTCCQIWSWLSSSRIRSIFAPWQQCDWIQFIFWLHVLGLKRGCHSHLSIENQLRYIKWSRGDSCWIHFSRHLWIPFVSIIESIASYVWAERWNGLCPPADVMMNCLACPSQALDKILFGLQNKTAGQRPGNTPIDKDQMVSRCVHQCV